MNTFGANGAPELGSEINGYVLESVLGRGGMGTVYLARGPKGGVCAVKVLSRRLVGDDPSFATRFKREVQYAEALDHPHVLELYEAGETPDGTLFFAMQYVDGPDLGVLLRRDGALSLPQALAILGPIGDALDCAHANGLVHRDVKPGNIIVANDTGGPYAYLTDFGLSKNAAMDSFALTRMGQMIGTLSYTAPEEILATEPRGHLVDIYSLGCVMYEALTGAPPFVRDRDINVLYAHVGDIRPRATDARSDLPAGIDDVIARAMAISAQDRYPTCAEFIAAAEALLPRGGAWNTFAGAVATPAQAEAATALPEPAEDPVAEPAAPSATEPPAELDAEPDPDPDPAAEADAEQASEPTPEPAAENESAPPGALRLVVRDGLGRGRVLLVEDEIVIGRMTTLDGALAPDHSISRRHARIRHVGDGAFDVEDEHSRNGTFLNGERLEEARGLQTGDQLKIGATVFEVTVPEATVPDEAVPEDAVPEDAVPEEAVPESGVPDQTAPEEVGLREVAPEASEPDAYEEFTAPPPEEIAPAEVASEAVASAEFAPAEIASEAAEADAYEEFTAPPRDEIAAVEVASEGAVSEVGGPEACEEFTAPPPDEIAPVEVASEEFAPAEVAPAAYEAFAAPPLDETASEEGASDEVTPAEAAPAPEPDAYEEFTTPPPDEIAPAEVASEEFTPAEIAPEATEPDAYEEFTGLAPGDPAAAVEAVAPAAEIVVETGSPGTRLALRLELDPEAGELIISIEGGATIRIVRGRDGWHAESP